MIHAWDNYPPAQFPPLWEWMMEQVETRRIQMSEVAIEEVKYKLPECNTWLHNAGLQIIFVDETILQEAFRIKKLLEIEEDNYGSGVDENDLIIIATAKIHSWELVTNEGFQPKLPKSKHKYKIPAVCGMDTVKIPWISFLGYLKRSEAVFE